MIKGNHMDEKRKSKRLRVSDYLHNNKSTPEQCFQVFNRGCDQFIGQLVDISVEGMMILSDQPIKRDTILEMKVELPEEIADGKQLVIKAKSLWWHQDDDNRGLCNNGFLIESSSIDLSYIMNQLLRDSDSLSNCQKTPVTTD